MNATYIRNTPAEMSPRAVKRIQDNLSRIYTPPSDLEAKRDILRRSIDANRNFASPELIDKWEAELAEIEKQIKEQQDRYK